MRFKLLNAYQIKIIPESHLEYQSLNDKKQSIHLNKNTIDFSIDRESKKLENIDHDGDLIAMICIIVIYPYLKKSSKITFPLPISKKIEQILELHQLNISIQSSHQDNLSNSNQLVKQETIQDSKKIQIPKFIMAWGGGIDSFAAYYLHPNNYQYLIHENHNLLPDYYDSDPELNYKMIKINTNQKKISSLADHSDAGWIHWIQVLVTTLWFLSYHKNERLKINGIALGGNLGSMFLNNGNIYYPAHLKPNLWFQTFKILELPLYIPLAGLTDLGIIKIIKSLPYQIDFKEIVYCWFKKGNCHSCPKCQRKEILFGINQTNIQQITNNNQNLGPSLQYIKSRNNQLRKWIYKYYQPALLLIPHSIRTFLINRLKERGIEFLSQEKEYLVEHWGNPLV